MSEVKGVQLRDGQSASNLFHKILWQATQQFEDLAKFSNLSSESKKFRSRFVEELPQFEAVRLSSSARSDIAQALMQSLYDEIVFHEGGEIVPLAEHLAKASTAIELHCVSGVGTHPWRFDMTYQGQRWDSPQVLADHLVSQRVISAAAGEALTWLQRQVLKQGELDLRDRRVVVLGAGAEMASTRFFLEAGAEVLWLDMFPPPPELTTGAFPGSLYWPFEPIDVLQRPAEMLATILGFADGGAIDLCLYAYAPGQARELRLTGAMNLLVDALPDEQVRSITMLVSPTTASELDAQDVLDMEARRTQAPWWEKTLGVSGVMGKPGCASCRYASVTRTLVNIQGASYQAAQYLGKVISAEVWHTRGFRVSANTAAITQTRSLDHPVFDAAFGGARALQVETFTPAQSQTINGLLAVHDWLSADRPIPGKIRVHGGIHTLPYPLDKALRIAAAIGFARSPGLLFRIFS